MKPEAQKVLDDAAARQVPEKMIDQLAKADDELRDGGKSLRAANDGSEIGHIQDVSTATEKVREAERDVEKASDDIQTNLVAKRQSSEKK